MCGILGTVPGYDSPLFQEALDTLAHRGPDGQGIWRDGESATLGHRRLTILDLTAGGAQPMVSEDGRYAVVYNGEIYNFLEIRKELESLGHSFRTESDTEVLISAYRQWGSDCLLRFNGMWAFALWDCRERVLFLARDRFGKKPLFYAMEGGRFIFSSEMKGIYPFLSEIRPSGDFAWMAQNLFDYEGTERCLVEGIKRFPGGHYGVLKDGRLRVTRYWNTLDHLEEVPFRYEDQVQRYRELFLDACRLRMRADVPIGTALSGGVDSSAVITAMSRLSSHAEERQSPEWQHAFVAAFPGTPLDETAWARKVVEHIGIGNTVIPIDPLEHVEGLWRDLYLFEDLYITSPVPMIAVYGAMSRAGIKVSVDGHGADEQFSGYGGSLLQALPSAGLNLPAISRILETYSGQELSGSGQFGSGEARWLLYARTMVRNILKPFLRYPPASRDKNHPGYRKLDSLNRHLYILVHETVLPTLLRNYDRYSMSRGVEIRMPFMDHRLVSYSMSLPWESKIRAGYMKAVIRDAVSDLVPREVIWRKTKVGFNSPVVDWMQGPLREFFMDMVASADFKTCGLIDPADARRKVLRVTEGHTSSFLKAQNAWEAVSPYMWERSLREHAIRPGEMHPEGHA